MIFRYFILLLGPKKVPKLLKPLVQSCNKRQKKTTPLVDFSKHGKAEQTASTSTQRRKGLWKSQVPIKKLVDSIVVEDNIDDIDTANQQMSNQENETKNNNTEYSWINFTTTVKPHKSVFQLKNSKLATPNPAPNITPFSCF